jgi:hypothetical protein
MSLPHAASMHLCMCAALAPWGPLTPRSLGPRARRAARPGRAARARAADERAPPGGAQLRVLRADGPARCAAFHQVNQNLALVGTAAGEVAAYNLNIGKATKARPGLPRGPL